MKNFSRGLLDNSGFSNADNGYCGLIGQEKYNEVFPEYISFVLGKKDEISSVKVVIDMAAEEKIPVIIIDIANANQRTVGDIMDYMMDSYCTEYEELDCYCDRLCFGYYNI